MSGDGDKDKNKAGKPYEIDYKKVGLSALLGVGGSILLGASIRRQHRYFRIACSSSGSIWIGYRAGYISR